MFNEFWSVTLVKLQCFGFSYNGHGFKSHSGLSMSIFAANHLLIPSSEISRSCRKVVDKIIISNFNKISKFFLQIKCYVVYRFECFCFYCSLDENLSLKKQNQEWREMMGSWKTKQLNRIFVCSYKYFVYAIKH